MTHNQVDFIMHPDLQRALKEDRARRNFNPKAWIEKKTDILNEYARKNGLKATVVNVSGGIDSAVTIALASYAMAKEGSPLKRVVGIAQPIHSTENIWKRALELGEAFKNVEIKTVDQTAVYDLLNQTVESSIGIKGGMFATGQLKSYMRTPVGFYTAQLLTQNGTPAVVIGTGNKDEDGYLFYFCKAGDGVADIQLIADLHKSEVFSVGHELGVPQSILVAPPSADLWEGQTDENELGFSYDFVELYTEYLDYSEEDKQKFRSSLSEEALKQFDDTGAAALKIHLRNNHKAKYPLNL
jgi:NAD+ synthase (glutamine-hydrolysing)